MHTFEEARATVHAIATAVNTLGGRTYYVGGYVRDRLMGRENTDLDIEVHGVTPQDLERILDAYGERIAIGESFGVYALKGYPIDIAMPRREHAVGHGHRDFTVSVDPFIGTEKAAARRDFTINALMQDVLTGEVVDHYGGQDDLRDGVLRHVNDESFAEDPLRVVRAAQFAARLGFSVAPATVTLCRSMDLTTLPRERIEGEWRKALLDAATPSVFFETLREMGQLDHWFPELAALIDVPQPPRWHAEGDVWNHTMMVLDAAAAYRDRMENPYAFMLAALAHDVGKAITTTVDGDAIHAYGHEVAGLPLAERLLTRITHEKSVIAYALSLVEYHMKPYTLAASNVAIKSTNRLFDSVPDPQALILIAAADNAGRITAEPVTDYTAWLTERLAVYREYMARPYVAGRDLVAAGLTADSRFADYLAYAHKLRLAGVDKETALKQTLAYARKTQG